MYTEAISKRDVSLSIIIVLNEPNNLFDVFFSTPALGNCPFNQETHDRKQTKRIKKNKNKQH